MIIDHHWLEALHIIAVTAWMVGLFYLPRLYVYHANAVVGSEIDKLFQTMEKRLLYYIMTPAMIVAAILGITLALTTGHMYRPWLHIKLLFVLGLILIHIFLYFCRKSFEEGNNKHSAKFYKILNESVTVLFSIIVILAVVKPF